MAVVAIQEPVLASDSRALGAVRRLGAHIVAKPNRAYVMRIDPTVRKIAMPDVAITNAPRLPRALLVVGMAAVLLVTGTMMLWVHYGTAVFYEMIVAGIAACF
jgi:hypothetical protein